MRITVLGSGYVGLVTGTCLADSGNHVVCVDIDTDKVQRLGRGECTIYEPGLSDLLADNLRAQRIRFTTDLAEGVRHGRVIFLAIGTPPDANGAADLTHILHAAEQIAPLIDGPRIIAIKSTVPVGTGRRIENALRGRTPHEVHVVSNPEFLKEGSAVDDFLRPDRVVVGADNDVAAQLVRELYLPFVRNNRPILTMGREAAELTKYAANAFLAARISFINEIANICDRHGIDVNEVREGIGTDQRIGFQFLYPGVGYGGSCFPKDVQALAHVAEQAGVASDLFRIVHEINIRQRRLFVDKVLAHFGGNVRGRTLALWGVTFKPKTDDIREAPALTIIEKLLEHGARIRAHDPQGLPHLKRALGDRVACLSDTYATLEGCDALLILTEWNEFRSPDFDRMRELLKESIVFDGRNLYEPQMMSRRGFVYYSVGRPMIPPVA